MLEELEVCQRRQYPAACVWKVQAGDQSAPRAEVVLANLVAEYMGLERLVRLVKESQARYVSVLIWDCDDMQALQAVTGRREEPRRVTAQEVITWFQENWLDLRYMDECMEICGGAVTRLDFKAMR